jgi:glutathione S-transferase
MLKLCGFAASNYHNKVKLALLEKGVPFEEVLAWIGETDRAASPHRQGALRPHRRRPADQRIDHPPRIRGSHRYPAKPAAARRAPTRPPSVRELLRYIELHLELVARNLYPEAFFGGQVSDGPESQAAPAA